MRVGILTFHRCINYGSYWQARCLVEGVRALGVDAVLLDHQSVAVERAELRCAFRPTLPTPVQRQDFPAYAAKTRKFRAAFDRLPLSAPFPLHQPEGLDGYDMVLVGSDEVWNLQHPWYGGCPTFYGAGVPARLAAYAASFGNQDSGLSSDWAARLDGFSALSVRDENSRRIVRAALGREPEMVLDPCLLFPPPRRASNDRSDHIAVYGHNFPRRLVEPVRRHARAKGLRLLSIGYRNDWADAQRIDAGPAEFDQLIGTAQAVVTNFFHGCVFALLHDRPLLAAPTPYRANKVHSFLASLDATDRIVAADSSAALLARLLTEPIDAAQPLATMRARSDRFLRATLGLAA